MRPSRLPPTQRPASAGRRDRALTVAAFTARLLLGRAVDLHDADDHQAVGLPAAAALLRQTASCAEAAAVWLRTEGRDGAPLPDTDRIGAALAEFRAAPARTPSPDGLPPQRLRLGALALSLGEWTKVLVGAVRVGRGRPRRARPPRRRRAPCRARCGSPTRPRPGLWWDRLREHLTPRSVYFQSAVRLAAALAVAGCWPASWTSSHGFWVLLTVLTAAAHLGRRDPVDADPGPGRDRARRAVVAAAVLVVGIPPPPTRSCCPW